MTLIDIFNKAMEEVELRQKVKDIETFYTNNSLIVYTPGTNSTQNIEDRTMTNEIQKVQQELTNLENALNKEARRVGRNAFMVADVRATSLKIDWSQEHEVVRRQIEHFDREMERFQKGACTGSIEVTIKGSDNITINGELDKQMRQFKKDILEKYARPMADLREKLHLLRKKADAESSLERLNNKNKGGAACSGCLFCDDEGDFFF